MSRAPLLVILSDQLSVLLRKGEFVDRYYNPGDLFDEVHILLTNRDHPDLAALQPTVGRARLVVHNLPAPSAPRTLGYQPALLEPWLAAGERLVQRIGPCLVRCHGLAFNAFLAARLKRSVPAPLVVSLHGNPDVDEARLARTLRERMAYARQRRLRERALRAVDHFILVYSPIRPYLDARGLKNYSLVPNVVGIGAVPKSTYTRLGPTLRCLCVGRQQSLQKDQRSLLRSLAEVPDVSLHFCGDGDLHDELVRLAGALALGDRVTFARATPNRELMRTMHTFDLYAYCSINYEISKAVMEAALVGLPIILNERHPFLAEELDGDYVLKVPNSPAGYARGLRLLATDERQREQLGRQARAVARERWSPERTEAALADLYRDLLDRR